MGVKMLLVGLKLARQSWELFSKTKFLWLMALASFGFSLLSSAPFFSGVNPSPILGCLQGLITLAQAAFVSTITLRGYQLVKSKRKIRVMRVLNDSKRYFERVFVLPFVMAIILALPVLAAAFVIQNTLGNAGFQSLVQSQPWLVLFVAGLVSSIFYLATIHIVIKDIRVGEAIGASMRFVVRRTDQFLALALIYTLISSLPALVSWLLSSLPSADNLFLRLLVTLLSSILLIWGYGFWLLGYSKYRPRTG
jgi:hypothetical protein